MTSTVQLQSSPELFENFPYGLVLVARSEGRVVNLNRWARSLLLSHSHGPVGSDWTCCELICDRVGAMLGGMCFSEQADEAGFAPEVRMELTTGSARVAAWVSTYPFESEVESLLFHLRPASPGDRRRRNRLDTGHAVIDIPPLLQISTLGRFRVEGPDESLGGEWLDQRPGDLLKFMVSERGRAVTNERIAEALWPDAGPGEVDNRVRYYVHILRERLEPNRSKRSGSPFINAGRGGYRLNIEQVRIDADEFEHEARAGIAAGAQGQAEAARSHLTAALRLYRDDFLSEDPYAEWALGERERLRELAVDALHALLGAALESDQLDEAMGYARRLAEMEPFDSDVQQTLLSICMKQGRHSEAVRRYTALRRRMLRSFEEEPDFELSEIDHSPSSASRRSSKPPLGVGSSTSSSARSYAARASLDALEPAQQLGPGRVQVAVVVEVEPSTIPSAASAPSGLGDRDGPVELDHRRAGEPGELAVERRDLRPVARLVGVQRRDRRLQDVRPAAAERQRPVE